MADIDVFNGDADGICSLQQLRLAEPRNSELITGVKRDIELVRQVQAAAGDRVTVLDISLDRNRDELVRLLEAGAEVRFFDHHNPGEIPRYANFEVHVDTSAEICTGLLVDDWLGGQYRAWAVTAAFGDNLDAAARRAAEPLGLAPSDLEALRELGILLNYNGYGAVLEDLFVTPQALYQSLAGIADPLDWIASAPVFQTLRTGYADDMARAQAVSNELDEPELGLYRLPDAPWARRVSGVYANDLANAAPERAHALLNEMADGSYRVSVRAPLTQRSGADSLCRQFATGGGRAAAAGINQLPASELEMFIECFRQAYGKTG